MNLGIKGGLNLYSISNSNYNTKEHFNAGLLSHFHLSDRVGLQPEIMFSGQGGKLNNSSNPRLNLSYINVPVLLQYMYNNGFRLQAGPQIGYLVSANSKNDGVSTDVKSGFNSLDFGISAGVSYVFVQTGIGLDARYNHGISNINENNANRSTNRGFQLGVFYMFKHN
ncbi:hypothetical protein DC20_00555 [Rufibacter tibetensis]|uniref:Outer membrane protein beta-barrel domain-containing protein n=2 Tax=Rufibacter tibetensis TaxID=512763 RepID=A0A0P0CLN9_9BACT|nr:hypothetical protein DC20_00555 [Rufibacter tibetensis]